MAKTSKRLTQLKATGQIGHHEAWPEEGEDANTLSLVLSQSVTQQVAVWEFQVFAITHEYVAHVATIRSAKQENGRLPSALLAVFCVPGAVRWSVYSKLVEENDRTGTEDASLFLTVDHVPSGVFGVSVLPGNAVLAGVSVVTPAVQSVAVVGAVDVTGSIVSIDNEVEVTFDEPVTVQSSYPKVAEMKALTPAGVAFPGAPDYTPTMVPSFTAKRWIFTLDTVDSTAIVEYSFDGTTVHGRLQLNRCDKISRDVQKPSIYLRYVTAAAVVNVHAEGV